MNNFPISTDLLSHLSIFSVAFRHSVGEVAGAEFEHLLRDNGWDVHHAFDAVQPKDRCLLNTGTILTETTRKICFPNYGLNKVQAESRLTTMLDAAKAGVDGIPGRSNSGLKGNMAVSLSRRRKENFVGVPLVLKTQGGSTKQQRAINFQVEWVDLWYFNDSVAVLSFKLSVLSVNDKGAVHPSQNIPFDDLALLNRHVRDMAPSAHWSVGLRDDPESDLEWWESVVLGRWLGGDISVSSAAPDKASSLSLLGTTEKPEDSIRSRKDNYSRYAKCLTMGEVSISGSGNTSNKETTVEPSRDEIEYLWNAPVTDPKIDFSEYFDSVMRGERMDVFAAYHFATMEGYPTLGDYLLYDLATTGSPGAAAGFNDQRGWQASPEYLRTQFEDGGIEVWEYWRGLALHDTLAFLSTDKTVPMSAQSERGSQAESLYYYLYVYLYHAQFKLNLLSSDIIDGELIDLYKSRIIQNRFNQFRNQYWFRDITIDFQGVLIANKIKQALRVNDAFETVESEVNDVAEFIDSKLEKGKQTLIKTLIVIAYPLFYLASISGLRDTVDKYQELHAWETGAVVSVMTLVFGFLLIRYAPEINMFTFKLYSRVFHRGKQ
ncbi:hypothetical protein NOR53_1576 [gamma proteobacterium NOR5-3]|nr:hypothetical protein NOR53_1576 [gamma proteobacterium NOR5-3]